MYTGKASSRPRPGAGTPEDVRVTLSTLRRGRGGRADAQTVKEERSGRALFTNTAAFEPPVTRECV